MHFFDRWSLSDERIIKSFSKYSKEAAIHYIDIDKQTSLRYLELWKKTWPLLILIHGAPGNISTWYNMIQKTSLVDTYRIFIVDRPWYGKSGYGIAQTSLDEQSRWIWMLLEKNNHKELPIIVWHSFGGPIVGKLLIDFPEDIAGWIIISGAASPEHEKIRGISYPMERRAIKPLIPKPLRVTNAEKFSHVAELLLLEPQRKDITHPLIVMHGYKDRIVPVENAYYIEKHAMQADIDMRIYKDGDNFLPFNRTIVVEKAINDMHEKISTK